MPASENYVTRLVRVENADVNEMSTVLTRIKGEQGDIIPYVPQNALIITDRAVNIDRMLRIMKEIDQPGGSGEKVWVVTVHNTAATDMAQKLADIFQVQQLGGKRGAARAGAGRAGRQAQGQRSRERAQHLEDHPRRALEPAHRHRDRSRVRARAHARQEARRAHRGRRRAHPRLLLRERELRRARGDAGRRHGRGRLGRDGRPDAHARRARRPRRRRRRRPRAARRARRTCSSRARCASTSIARRTPSSSCRRSRTTSRSGASSSGSIRRASRSSSRR